MAVRGILNAESAEKVCHAIETLLSRPRPELDAARITHLFMMNLRPVEQKWLGLRLGVYGHARIKVKDIAKAEAVTSARVSQVTRGALHKLAEMLNGNA